MSNKAHANQCMTETPIETHKGTQMGYSHNPGNDSQWLTRLSGTVSRTNLHDPKEGDLALHDLVAAHLLHEILQHLIIICAGHLPLCLTTAPRAFPLLAVCNSPRAVLLVATSPSASNNKIIYRNKHLVNVDYSHIRPSIKNAQNIELLDNLELTTQGSRFEETSRPSLGPFRVRRGRGPVCHQTIQTVLCKYLISAIGLVH